MENSQLIIILRTFSKKEIREFRKWLHSPCHNQRSDVTDLFEYLVAGDHLYNEKFLQKDWLFRKIFSQEDYNDAKLRQTIHFLYKSVEDFLIYQEQMEDEVRSKMALASVYRKRKLDKSFQKTMKGIEELQERSLFRNEQFLRNEYLLQQERYIFLENQKRNIPMNLQEVSDALDTTYFADKLRQSCLILAHQKVYRADYKVGLLTEVMEYVEENGFLKIPAIAVYYYGYKAFTNPQGRGFFSSLKQVMFENVHLFPKSEIRDIYLMTINYCIGRMNAGEGEFIREAFELYRKGLEAEILIENNSISPWTFINIVLNGLKLGEFTWVKNFISSHQKFLSKEKRKNFVHYSMARLHFEKKDYSEAMLLLVQSDFDDILLNLNAKIMLMKIYYELEESDALDSLLESMRTYILRKKVMGYHKSNYQNIIRYTKKLVKINPFQKEEKRSLLEEIQSANPLTEKQWLVEQLEAL